MYFSPEFLEKYKEESEKNFEFPIGVFDYTITNAKMDAVSKATNNLQAEITFKIHIFGKDMERKDWFGYAPTEAWKWSTLLKSCGLHGKVSIQHVRPVDLIDTIGKLEGKDVTSKTKFNEDGSPVVNRRVVYLPKKEQTNFIQQEKNVSPLNKEDIPF
jgi:hypothetical protein